MYLTVGENANHKQVWYDLKECHPCCVYQNYSRSMIKEWQSKTQLYLYLQWRTNYMFRPFR